MRLGVLRGGVREPLALWSLEDVPCDHVAGITCMLANQHVRWLTGMMGP